MIEHKFNREVYLLAKERGVKTELPDSCQIRTVFSWGWYCEGSYSDGHTFSKESWRQCPIKKTCQLYKWYLELLMEVSL